MPLARPLTGLFMLPAIDFAALFRASPNPYVVFTRDLIIVDANPAYLAVTGTTHEAIVGRHLFEAFPDSTDREETEGRQRLRASFARVIEKRERDTVALIRYRVPLHDGDADRYWSATHSPILGEDGEVAFIVQHTMDVTELRRLQSAAEGVDGLLRGAGNVPIAQAEANVFGHALAVQRYSEVADAERRRLRMLFEQAPGFIAFVRGPDHVFEFANRAYRQLVGHRDVVGKPVRDAMPELVGQGYFELLDQVFTSGEAYIGRAQSVVLSRLPGGQLEEVLVDFIYQPVIEDDGSVSGILVQGSDVTARKQAQDELRNYRDRLEELVDERTRALRASEDERRQTEAALVQAQKMEAVGKLTGGVAHDFNNVLQIIGGNLQLLAAEPHDSVRVQRRLQAATTAVQRGERLASQLLSFARRQPLDPRVVNPAALLRGMDDLLRHALGEGIELETIVAGGLWNTFVDAHHLENVILNLALNARDAMQGHGRLTIEAGNAMLDERYAASHGEVTPGQYLMLAVSDTGCGMPPEVVERAFEPFFTTKPMGQGTGLGLSMAYGFVKQSEGHIKIYSEVGHGTTIKIYLPRSVQTVAEPVDIVSNVVTGGSETILVVEDDDEVRATVVDMLTALGYQVLKAADAQSALGVLNSGVPIDLIFTDVVMPGPIRSTELARHAMELIPDIEILFTSGYTENAIIHGGRLDPGVHLLSKPYRQEDLAKRVHHLLRNREQRLLLRESTRQREEKAAPATAEPARVQFGSLRILLVEDNAETLQATTDLLELLGHEVTPAASAEEALERLAGGTFDVMCSDISLPNMSGRDLARIVRRDYPTVGIIFASGYGDPGAAGDGIDAVILPKPYKLEELESALETAMLAR